MLERRLVAQGVAAMFEDLRKIRKQKLMLATAFFFITYTVLPSCSTAIFSIFSCESFDDGTSVLRVDMGISCDDGAYVAMFCYAMCMLVSAVWGYVSLCRYCIVRCMYINVPLVRWSSIS